MTMKKILLFFVALVATLSMNAQTTEIYKGATKEATYSGADVTVKFGTDSIRVSQGDVTKASYPAEYKVVSKELPPTPAGSIGKAKRTGGIDVNWVQLWEGGPKFAEYNVGATSATDYGGYYAWGGSQDKVDDHNTGSGNLTGTDDTAIMLWGNNWRMPTADELGKQDGDPYIDGLLGKCTVEWIDGINKKYNDTDAKGLLCTGKGDYATNSIFLPAAGYCEEKVVNNQGMQGLYWSSTRVSNKFANDMRFGSNGYWGVFDDPFGYCISVRAVLYEGDK